MIPATKKIFSILNLSQKKEFFLLIFLLFIGAILEMLGIGMLLPVLTSLTGENLSNYIYGEKILIFCRPVYFWIRVIVEKCSMLNCYRRKVFDAPGPSFDLHTDRRDQ